MGQEGVPSALLCLVGKIGTHLVVQSHSRRSSTVINVNNSQCRSVTEHREVLCRKAMHLPRRRERGSPNSDQTSSIQLASVPQTHGEGLPP